MNLTKYLMLDRRLLNPQAMENVGLQAVPPKKDILHNPLFVQDQPWEIRIDNGYPNVIYDRDEGLFRCYYTLFTEDLDTEKTTSRERATRAYQPRTDRITSLAYAESKDGIHWIKPKLDRVEWRGNTKNNLLFPYAHGTGVMLDFHETDLKKKYKLVTKVEIPGQETFMAVAFSPDGKDWSQLIPWPEHNPPADSHNLPFWNEKERCYMLLSRVWRDGIRITTISQSRDFLHWSEPKEALRGYGFEQQIYSMPVFYWEGLYLGIASLIHEGDRKEENFDTVDCQLTWSADAEHFDFVAPGQYLIPRGKGHYPTGEFDCGCIYASPPLIDGEGNMWLYYMGGNGRHTNFRESSLARAQWLPDRFAALLPRRKDEESLLTTNRLRFNGNRLEILAEALEPEKPILLEAQLHEIWTGAPLTGYTFAESHLEEIQGWISINWGKSLQELNGRSGCLKLRFKNLILFALRGEISIDGHRLWEGADISLENKSEKYLKNKS